MGKWAVGKHYDIVVSKMNHAGILLLFAALSIVAGRSSAVMPCECQSHTDDVRLSDADRFGVSKPDVRKNFTLARFHATDELRFTIWQNNGPDVSANWEADCRFRGRAWDLLDDVIYCSYPDGKKLDSLRRLREMIGETDYRSGRMPAPTPTYRK